MKAGYKTTKNTDKKPVSKGYASNVKVVNTPTVKIEHEKMKPEKPTLRLSSDDLESLKNWKVGNTYKLLLEVEQTSMRQGSEYEFDLDGDESKDKTSATFKILKVSESK